MIEKNVCRDFADGKLIEAALTAKCRTLIVRNQDVVELEKPFGIDILAPREWLETLTPSQKTVALEISTLQKIRPRLASSCSRRAPASPLHPFAGTLTLAKHRKT
jgi:hypothetical protein